MTPSLAPNTKTPHYCHEPLLDSSKLRTLMKEPGPPFSLIRSTSTTVCLYTRSTAVDDDLPSDTTLLSAFSPQSSFHHLSNECDLTQNGAIQPFRNRHPLFALQQFPLRTFPRVRV